MSVRSLDRKTTKVKSGKCIICNFQEQSVLNLAAYRGGFFLKTNEKTERHLNIESTYFVGRSSEQLVIDTDTRKDT